MIKHTRQDVIYQLVMAPTHRILNEWACVGLSLVVLEVYLHITGKPVRQLTSPPCHAM